MNGFLWIYFLSLLDNLVEAVPAGASREDSSVHIGPCVWVMSRNCPDPDVEFYIFTRSNPNDRQAILPTATRDLPDLNASNYNRRHPVKIVIHGYNSDMFLNPLIQMKDEYLQRGEYNVFYVDWSSLAPGPCYPSAVHNSRHVGKCIGQLVEQILATGNENIHLIGFSLGAQVTNYIARAVAPWRLPRITGLDPAMPLFVTAAIEDKLDESDADFVDVLHTNALVQGKMERCGHVDFYFNGGVMQSGCFQMGTNPFACSHHRAPDYFSESIQSSMGFWGWACESYIYYLFGFCPPGEPLVMAGEDCRTDMRGMYIISTNAESPFAKGRKEGLTQPVGSSEQPPMTMMNVLKGRNPFDAEIDKWGKLDGNFNNKKKDLVSNLVVLPDETRLIKNENMTRFWADYKQNLTKGVVDHSVFQVPKVIVRS